MAIFTDLESGEEKLVELPEINLQSCGEGIYLAQKDEDGVIYIVDTIRCIFPLLPVKEENKIICPEVYAPVCGMTPDGSIQTFSNACYLGASEAKLLAAGECRTNDHLKISFKAEFKFELATASHQTDPDIGRDLDHPM